MAMNAEKPNAETHDDIDLLLPLQAAGLLSRAEQERVEAALARDPAKARRLAQMQIERAAVIEANESIPLQQAALVRLMRDVDAEPAPVAAAAAGRDVWSKAWSALAGLAEPAMAFRFAALIVAALVGGLLTYGVLMRGEGYQVAGGDTGQANRGPTVIVRFADDARASAIQEALRQAAASIISGPKGDNFFEIRFRTTNGLAPVEERIRQLEARRDIVRQFNRAGE
jgi:hypothetical protein